MTFAEAVEDGAYLTLPKASADDVDWRWYMDYYDGPLAGMVHYRGEDFWCEFVSAGRLVRRFLLARPTPEQMVEAAKWNGPHQEKPKLDVSGNEVVAWFEW